MKRFDDFDIGDPVWEKDFCTGTVASMSKDRTNPTHGYILARTAQHEYTIYMILTDAKSEPVLPRHVPEDVMIGFADEIKSAAGGNPSAPATKYPVTDDDINEQSETKEVQSEPKTNETNPYFDFV